METAVTAHTSPIQMLLRQAVQSGLSWSNMKTSMIYSPVGVLSWFSFITLLICSFVIEPDFKPAIDKKRKRPEALQKEDESKDYGYGSDSSASFVATMQAQSKRVRTHGDGSSSGKQSERLKNLAKELPGTFHEDKIATKNAVRGSMVIDTNGKAQTTGRG